MLESEEELHESLLEALGILVQISLVEDNEIFKICLEYWQWLGDDLYASYKRERGAPGAHGGLHLGGFGGGAAESAAKPGTRVGLYGLPGYVECRRSLPYQDCHVLSSVSRPRALHSIRTSVATCLPPLDLSTRILE